MANYTKANIRLDLWQRIKIKAAADNRSATNYIETLLLADLEADDPVNNLVVKSRKPSKSVANPPSNGED